MAREVGFPVFGGAWCCLVGFGYMGISGHRLYALDWGSVNCGFVCSWRVDIIYWNLLGGDIN